MKFLYAILINSILLTSVLAQQSATISGTVKNEGKAVNDAEVLLLRSDESVFERTITDQNGNYTFSDVPNGEYKIKINYNDNSSVSSGTSDLFSIKGISIRHDVNGVIYTQTELIREEVNVEVSAGTSQPISEVSKTVNVINDEEVADRNEMTLTDTLRTIPGFRVQQLGGFGKTASIKTRGLRNQDTAILIDGIRFRDAASITGDASAFLSDFSTANVGRIEVLRGSGSSIYGTNAIGGVVDFQTPRPQNNLNGSFLSEYGRYGLSRFRGDVGTGTSDGKIAFTTGFSRTDVRSGIDGEDDADNTNLQGKVDFQATENTYISGRFYFSNAFVRLNSSPDTLGTIPSGQIIDANEGVNFVADQNDPDAFQKSRFFNGQIFLTNIINSKTIFSANYQGLTSNRENEDDILGVGFQSFFNNTFDGQIHTLNTKFDWIPISNNRLTVGYEFEWEKFANEGFQADGSNEFSTSAVQSSNTFYIQNLLGLMNDKLQLAGGFRFQNFSLKTPQATPTTVLRERFTNLESPPNSYTFDGAASYYFDKTDTKLRFHIGNGFRVPSLYERFGSFFFLGGFTFIGNPDLKPEKSIGIDGGIEEDLFDKRLKLSATYFYTRIKDEIAYLPTDDFAGEAYFNADRRFSRGFETSAEYKFLLSTNLFVSYTYTNSDERNFRRLTFLPPATLVSTDQKSFGIPNHQFSFIATQQIGKRLTLNFDFLATSDYLAPIFSNSTFSSVTYRFKGNRRGDLTGRYEIPAFKEKVKFTFFGTVENIFDYEYFENGFRTQGISGRFGVGMKF